MNAKTIAAIKEIADLLYSIVECESGTTTEEKTRTRKPATSRKPAAVEENTTATADSEYTREDLDGMTYNAIKKLAKSMGITASGDRDTLVNKILGEDADESEPEVESSDEAQTKKGPGRRKMVSKKPEPESENEPDTDDSSDDGDDDLYTQVSEAVEDMETEDIIELLTEAGVKVRKGGKRQTVINTLVKAVEDGLIDLSDDEESDEENDDEETEDSSPRSLAIEKSNEDIDKQFEDGDITRDDLIEWYCDAYGEKPIKVKKMKDEALLDAYKEASALFIDDAGETHEEGDPYEVNGEPYCCGAPLKYNKDDNSYICEQCGNEYNAEE